MSVPNSRSPRVRAFIAFGANLGNPASAYEHAITAVDSLPETSVVTRSGLYRSAPVGVSGQPDYINAVIEVATALAPPTLLDGLLGIEREAGRVRESHHAPRTLDLDLLLYGDEVIRTPGLEVPHPRMHLRAFVLVPLAEIAPDITVPGYGSVSQLLPAVAGQQISRL